MVLRMIRPKPEQVDDLLKEIKAKLLSPDGIPCKINPDTREWVGRILIALG